LILQTQNFRKDLPSNTPSNPTRIGTNKTVASESFKKLQISDIAHLRQVCHNSKFGIFWVISIERNVCRCTCIGIASQRSLQNSPLESSCVIVALTENYSTSKPLKVSPEKLHILSCDTAVVVTVVVVTLLWLWHCCGCDTAVMVTLLWLWHCCGCDTAVVVTLLWLWHCCHKWAIWGYKIFITDHQHNYLLHFARE
jgi:hypothetical protein